MVGVALPFSIASRVGRGQSLGWLQLHAWWRALVLICLAAFAAYPAPPPDFDVTSVGVPANWPHWLTGFEAHWNKNTNFAAAFDRWFLNLFPRERTFAYNGGGYQTLSFIPTLGTMIMGLLAGNILRGQSTPARKVIALVGAGIGGLVLGYGLHYLGVCPLVKRIWTPSFALASGGWCFLILAALYQVIDIAKLRAWAFPLVVIGMNSIAIYVMDWTISGFVVETIKTHLGQDVFSVFGEAYESLVSGSAVLTVFWLILYWMYRRRIFLRI
jgi:predicted acyltransferase